MHDQLSGFNHKYLRESGFGDVVNIAIGHPWFVSNQKGVSTQISYALDFSIRKKETVIPMVALESNRKPGW